MVFGPDSKQYRVMVAPETWIIRGRHLLKQTEKPFHANEIAFRRPPMTHIALEFVNDSARAKAIELGLASTLISVALFTAFAMINGSLTLTTSVLVTV